MTAGSGREPPKMLQNVLNAIVNLRDAEGSTVRNIVRHINTSSSDKPARRRKDITLQVRRALKQGSRAGVIVQHSRKYKLAATPSKCNNILARSYASRRRRSRRKRRSRARRRRRRSEDESATDVSDLQTDASSATGAEVTEACRRKRRRSRRRKCSRRRRRKYQEEQQSLDDKSDDDDNEGGSKKRARRQSSADKGITLPLFHGALHLNYFRGRQ